MPAKHGIDQTELRSLQNEGGHNMAPDMMDMLTAVEDLPTVWSQAESSVPETIDTPRFPRLMSMDLSTEPALEGSTQPAVEVAAASGGGRHAFDRDSVLQAGPLSGAPLDSPFAWTPSQPSSLRSQPSWVPDMTSDLWAGPSISQPIPPAGLRGARMQQAPEQGPPELSATMLVDDAPAPNFYFPEWNPPTAGFFPPSGFPQSQSWSPNTDLARLGGYGGSSMQGVLSWVPSLEGGSLHEQLDEPLSRRGFSLGELPSLRPNKEGLKLERPRSHDRMLAAVKTKEVGPDGEPADERSSGPFAFKTSRLNVDASNAEAPASSLKNKGSTESQGEEAGPHQLRPRLEASQPKNPNTSVHLLDATGTELGSDESGNLLQKTAARSSVKRAAGGGQRMTYRVRSNALADLQMPNLKSRPLSDSGTKDAPPDAQRVLKTSESERAASTGKPLTSRGTKLSTSDSSLSGLSTPANPELDQPMGQQAGEDGCVKMDPVKLQQFARQLQHIQGKVARLQQERLATSKREEAIQMAGRSMQRSVQDLAVMKAGGASVEDREARLAEGAHQLQQLLGLLGPVGLTPADLAPPPEGHQAPVPEPQGSKMDVDSTGGDQEMEDA